MKIYYKLILIGLIVFGIGILGSNAQVNIVPGKVFFENGDSISGYFNYAFTKLTPTSIEFKKTLNGKFVKYGPLDIEGFNILNKKFISANVVFEKGVVAAFDESNEEVKYEQKDVFLQYLVRGEKSLLFSYQRGYKRLFYISKDDGYELLIGHRFLSNNDGDLVFKNSVKYRVQLSNYLDGNQEVMNELKESKYSQKSLMRIFKNYYNSTKKENWVYKKSFDPGIRIFALAGVAETKMRSSIDNTRRWDNEINIVEDAFVPMIGASLDLYINKYTRKSALNLGIRYSQYEISDTRNYWNNDDYFLDSRIAANSHDLKVSLIYLRRFHYRDFNISGGIGFENSYYLNSEVQKDYQYQFYTTTDDFNAVVAQESDKSLVLECGFEWKNLGIRYRYWSIPSLSFYGKNRYSLGTNSFLVSYGF